MTLINRLSIVIASALLVFSPAFAGNGPKPAPLLVTAPKAAPSISYLDAKGAKQTLEPFKNKLTIVHFWATWCVPCIDELPEIDAIAREVKPEGVAVLALALDGSKIEKITDFYKAHRISTLTANHDPNYTALRAVGGKQLPYTVFINARGEQIAHINGTAAWESKEVIDFIKKNMK